MKKVFALLLLIAAFGITAGCHSNTMRGAGSDVEKIGENMQK